MRNYDYKSALDNTRITVKHGTKTSDELGATASWVVLFVFMHVDSWFNNVLQLDSTSHNFNLEFVPTKVAQTLLTKK